MVRAKGYNDPSRKGNKIMKISKVEALALSKVLSIHVPTNHFGAPNEQFKILAPLASRIDRFILADEADGDHTDAEYGHKESPVKASYQPIKRRDPGEDDDAEADDEKALDDPDVVQGGDLHDLKPASTKDGTLEFEYVEDACRVDFLVDGLVKIRGVESLQRNPKSLKVNGESSGATLTVQRFPKGWTHVLPAGVLVKVEA